jgi:hypothetical protein
MHHDGTAEVTGSRPTRQGHGVGSTGATLRRFAHTGAPSRDACPLGPSNARVRQRPRGWLGRAFEPPANRVKRPLRLTGGSKARPQPPENQAVTNHQKLRSPTSTTCGRLARIRPDAYSAQMRVTRSRIPRVGVPGSSLRAPRRRATNPGGSQTRPQAPIPQDRQVRFALTQPKETLTFSPLFVTSHGIRLASGWILASRSHGTRR